MRVGNRVPGGFGSILRERLPNPSFRGSDCVHFSPQLSTFRQSLDFGLEAALYMIYIHTYIMVMMIRKKRRTRPRIS